MTVGLFQKDVLAWVKFGCGREYFNDPAGMKRHESSGCKGCRRYLRKQEAIWRRIRDGMKGLNSQKY